MIYGFQNCGDSCVEREGRDTLFSSVFHSMDMSEI